MFEVELIIESPSVAAALALDLRLQLAEQAIWCIGNLAADSDECRYIILNNLITAACANIEGMHTNMHTNMHPNV